MSEERWTVIRQRGLWSSMTTLHIYMIHILQQSHFLLGLNWHWFMDSARFRFIFKHSRSTSYVLQISRHIIHWYDTLFSRLIRFIMEQMVVFHNAMRDLWPMNIPLGGKERLYIIEFNVWATAVKLMKNNTSAPFLVQMMRKGVNSMSMEWGSVKFYADDNESLPCEQDSKQLLESFLWLVSERISKLLCHYTQAALETNTNTSVMQTEELLQKLKGTQQSNNNNKNKKKAPPSVTSLYTWAAKQWSEN